MAGANKNNDSCHQEASPLDSLAISARQRTDMLNFYSQPPTSLYQPRSLYAMVEAVESPLADAIAGMEGYRWSITVMGPGRGMMEQLTCMVLA